MRSPIKLHDNDERTHAIQDRAARAAAAADLAEAADTKTVTLRDGSTLTLYRSDALGWVTIPEDD